jgi:hypothetical protein
MADEKDPKEVPDEMTEEIVAIFDHFAPGGKMGPIEDPAEYERLTSSLPPLERELNREVTNFMRLVDFFGRINVKLGQDVADAMFAAAKLPVEQRIGRVREINEMLMKRLGDAGKSAEFRM